MKRARESRSPITSPDLIQPQRIEERGANNHVVVHSPYGSNRIKYGWGHLFKPPLSADVPSHPTIHIGLSSLNSVPGKDRRMSTLLSQYLTKFHCLEHCYPFHNMGDEAAWIGWREMCRCNLKKDNTTQKKELPFMYTIKANSYLTHTRMLALDDNTSRHMTDFFERRCALLGPHLGPILLQLPPHFIRNAENTARVETFAMCLPSNIRIAVEFRHRSWYAAETYALLRRIKWALVVAHHFNDPTGSLHVDTGVAFMYVRLHGSIGLHLGDYGPTTMSVWAERVVSFIRAAPLDTPLREVFFFLNNSDSQVGGVTSSTVDATFLAERLKELLTEGRENVCDEKGEEKKERDSYENITVVIDSD